MSNLRVCRELDVNEQECQELAVELLDKLVSAFGGKYKPDGSNCLLYTSPSPRDQRGPRMPSSA